HRPAHSRPADPHSAAHFRQPLHDAGRQHPHAATNPGPRRYQDDDAVLALSAGSLRDRPHPLTARVAGTRKGHFGDIAPNEKGLAFANPLISLVPLRAVEPPTFALRMRCSTY